ncbi:MAG TPA: hypothetical protein VGE10_13295, partial [Zeimonas sp.]
MPLPKPPNKPATLLDLSRAVEARARRGRRKDESAPEPATERAPRGAAEAGEASPPARVVPMRGTSPAPSAADQV